MKEDITGKGMAKRKQQARRQQKREELTVGIDIGDRSSCYCILDQTGEVSSEGKLPSTTEAYRQQFGGMARATIASAS